MRSARCSVEGCRRKPHARGLCQRHYDEQRKQRPSRPAAAAAGEAPAPPPAAGRAPAPVPVPEGLAGKVCTVPGCPNPHHARGYCKMHYGQLRRHGRIEDVPAAESAASAPLTKEQRLIEIKKRHEIIKKEIASIHKALESESDEDVEVEG